MPGGPSRSQRACSAPGSWHEANPLSRASKPIPARAACRLARSWPLMHGLAVQGKYVQNLMKNGPKSASTQ